MEATVANSSTTTISAVNGPVAPGAFSDETVAINIDGTSKTVVTFGNNLTQISPTGVIIRVAPYLLILAAGIALLVIFAVRRRKHSEED